MAIAENILKIRQGIVDACGRVNRSPGEITIVAVSKGRSAGEIKEAFTCGITEIGENRMQEAAPKFQGLRAINPGLRTHMVGHLQSNKAKEAVKIFDLIQSVDSLHLALEIDRQAARINKRQDILLEIKTSEEITKFGIMPEGLEVFMDEAAKLKNLHIKGLMTIAPLLNNPEEARPYFRQLKELLSLLKGKGFGLNVLSMGMSDDYKVAIEEGATMIRLGRAIFG